MTCPFCERAAGPTVRESNGFALAIPDGFPVSPGHTLVVPRRHEQDLFRLPSGELQALWDLVRLVSGRLVAELKPDGINVGVNVGVAAGQTVDHAHVHVIPRWKGDVEDPRGGVRWVLPAKARYWR